MATEKLATDAALPMEPTDPDARRRAVEEAIAEVRRGATVSHDEVRLWLKSLGTDKPLPRPHSGKR